MKKSVVFLICIILTPLTAWAQDRDDWIPILEPSSDGGLIHTGKFDYKKNYTGGIWDTAGPPSAIVIQNGRQAPVVTQKGLDFLNDRYGGRGTIKITSASRAASPNPIDLDAIGKALPPMELFDDDGGPAVAPLDGVWTSRLDLVSEEGCPPGSAASVLSALGKSASRQVTFSVPHWKPGDFGAEFAKMEWEKMGENAFIANPYTAPTNVQESGIDIVVQMQMKAQSNTQFDVRAKILASFSKATAAIVGSSQICKVVARGKYTRR